MKRISAIVVVVLGLGTGSATAQETYSWTAFLTAGAAGSYDDDGASEFGGDAWQAGLGMFIEERTMAVVRVGRLSLDDGLAASGLADATLEYVDVAGEYRFRQPAYDLGIYLGLGAYRREGTGASGSVEDTELGATLGFSGDFDLTARWSIVAEIDLHYVLLEEARLYGAALVGVAVHF